MTRKHPRLEDHFGRISAALAAGVLTAAGQAPVNWGLPTFLGLLAGAWLFLQQPTGKRVFWTGWFFGAAYFATALHWIVEPFFVDAAQTGWMAPFAIAAMAAGGGLFWAAAWRVGFVLGRSSIAWATLMAGAELIRAYLFTGFPWAMPSYAWVSSWVIQIASYVGPHGANFLLFLLAAALAQGLRKAGGVTWGSRVGIAAVVALSILPIPEVSERASDGPLVRLIQPNAPQHEKWDPDRLELFFDRQISLTKEAGSPDVVVWPETAVAFAIPYADALFSQMSEAADGATVITGVQRVEGMQTFNSMAVLSSNGEAAQVYDKHHLVPFGEYIPLGQWLGGYGLRGLAAQDGVGYAPGPGPQVLDIPDIGYVLPLICYEVVFPQDLRVETRPDMILQITNDAWFGTFAGPQQHLAQARMRAIETGLPVLRSANTGMTAVIDARGRLLDQLPMGTLGKLDTHIPAARTATVYSRFGDMPVVLLLICITLIYAYRTRRNSN